MTREQIQSEIDELKKQEQQAVQQVNLAQTNLIRVQGAIAGLQMLLSKMDASDTLRMSRDNHVEMEA